MLVVVVEGRPAVFMLMCFNIAWVGEDERALEYVENLVASVASHTASLSLRLCNMAWPAQSKLLRSPSCFPKVD